MKFQSFSRILPAIAAMFNRGAVTAPPTNKYEVTISNSGGWNMGQDMPHFAKDTPRGEFHPIKNQRKKRKNLRRRIAAGFKF